MRQTPLLLLLLLSTTCDALRIIPSARARPPVMGYRPVKAPSAEEAAAKNPTAADRPEMSDRYKGLTANERDTKKNTRSRIMKKKEYKRGGNPFDRSIHRGVSEKMSERFAGELVNEMKEDQFRELRLGEGNQAITFVLAKEFGFCWGVERSIELAWAAREAYPEKRMHITNELIHNPGVNELLKGFDIQFMEKDNDAECGKRFDTVGEGDVVILPAFGASLEEIKADEQFREMTRGEGNGAATFVLAKEYGFCWGVERSIELAWAARDAYPDKKMHITNELIHNPGVNDMLQSMDVEFIEKTEEGKRFDDVEEGDVVILPAFGASLEEMQYLDQRDVTVVDTTCPSVSKVWTTVDKHQLSEMTSVIHGKYQHEEAIATASMCETYLIIKDMAQAQEVAPPHPRRRGW